ncbi:Copper resistance protein A precursor [Pseudovibrio axinellae]|uniref:Copper resistance protein A n=1 Tax=Pseudovibrio axinellae TaxID=989403 RepID=A0A165TVQ6_9HYPH|nr:multicopper oxidase family protein [Pseudovibrio axinellae]KZL06688.1 Copper resistance protein A precursor [Pseudovibrio axinellae]SER60786.1 Tat (twin-arginine translocation) pathway signal sequence [Pseudovibrio axinellae]
MKLSRRDFVKTSTSGTLAAGAVALIPGSAEANQPKSASGSATPPEPSACAKSLLDAGVSKPDFTLDVDENTYSEYGVDLRGLLVGGTWPGTPIRYTQGDMFRVLINNRMRESTCIHWHGLLLPSLLDGVPEIAQLPIAAGTSQYYEFPLVQSGSYYYHSHLGAQEQYGLLGSLIIDARINPYSYDHDEVLMFCDIPPAEPKETIEDLRAGKARPKVKEAYEITKGETFDIDVLNVGYTLNGNPNSDPWTLKVKKGARLRLRLINSSGSTFFKIGIDGLKFTVIEVDGNRMKPIEGGAVIVPTSARYDVLVDVPESGSYTIHAAALGDNKQCLGVIHTEDVKAAVNKDRAKFEGATVDFRSLTSFEPSGFGRKVGQIYDVLLSGDMRAYEWMMNDHYWPEEFAGPDPEKTYLDVRRGDVVQLRMINRTEMAHPMHLHGHTFRVLGGPDDRNAPVMDTVWVPKRQTVTIEFLANNPGMWAFHCHNIWHLAVGMMQPVRYVVNERELLRN